MNFRHLIAFIVIILIDANAVQAGSYISRGFPGETKEAKIALAESSEPIWYEVGSTPVKLSEIIDEVCGNQPTEFLEYLLKQAVKLNDERFPGLPVEVGSVVAVPFCHKIERQIMINVGEGESLYRIAKTHMGVAGPKTLASIVELNDGPKNPNRYQIQNFSKELSAGQRLKLPYRTTKRVFHKVSDGLIPQEIIAKHPPHGFDIEAAYETISTTVQRKKHYLAPVGFVPSHSKASTESCPGSGYLPGSPPFNLELLRERLAAEINFLKSIGEPPEPAIVGIIDTGLKGVGNDFFPERLFAANKAESGPFSVTGKDDDGNYHIDDIWGTNFSNRDGIIEAFGGDGSRHGTLMAALCLGGVEFLQSISSTESPIVKLKIVNFSKKIPAGLMSPSLFPEAVQYLADYGQNRANIINVSLSSSSNFRPIDRAIHNHQNVLFVVAAANNMAGGSNLSIKSVYPALFGGEQDSARNVITVASHTSTGLHAAHSNWGKNVDLHAPGCAINSVDNESAIVTETGSSVAAANVSFTAGVVRALGKSLMPPAKIKKRLIASSDMDEGLGDCDKNVDSGNCSWTKARMNIVKAISLTHDVIELKNKSSYLFTHLKSVETLRPFCMEIEMRKQLNNILKVRPHIEVENGTASQIEYWIDVPNRIAKIRCSQANSNRSIGTLAISEEETVGPRLSDVTDIVIAPLRLP